MRRNERSFRVSPMGTALQACYADLGQRPRPPPIHFRPPRNPHRASRLSSPRRGMCVSPDPRMRIPSATSAHASAATPAHRAPPARDREGALVGSRQPAGARGLRAARQNRAWGICMGRGRLRCRRAVAVADAWCMQFFDRDTVGGWEQLGSGEVMIARGQLGKGRIALRGLAVIWLFWPGRAARDGRGQRERHVMGV
uniref:Uncharacterized protein n=1 Tax=Oryza glaberrima TaxID=4538 RepID=I1QEB5_ORYGL